MKKYEISEDFILEAHKEACSYWQKRIEKEVPELFKFKLEVGKWYRSSNKPLAFCSKIINDNSFIGYGFGTGSADVWYGEDERLPWDGSKWTLATEEEVKEALIKEAEKRGFKKGIKFISARYKCTEVAKNGSIIFFNDDFTLTLDGNYIFDKGKWAEIIKETEVTQSDLIQFYKEQKGIDSLKIIA